MAILDFLFEGSPPASVTTYGQTVENLPAWYSDYTQGLIARANAIAAEPFQTYGKPRIATLDPYQTSAYTGTAALEGDIKPKFQAARDTLTSAGQAGALSAAQQYIDEAASGARGAASTSTAALASPYLSQAEQLAQGAAAGTAGLAQPYLTDAQRLTEAGAAGALSQASPYLNTAGQKTSQAMGATTANLAAPALQSAQQMTNLSARAIPGAIGQYMDPYRQQVVDRIGQLGQRQLTENILPVLQAQGISSGQFGGTRSAEAMGRAVRDINEGILAQQAQALSQGYGEAAQLAQADAARQLQAAGQTASLGTTAAGLAGQDIARQTAAAQQYGDIGAQLAAIEAQDQQRALTAGQQMGALGSTAAGLESADLARQLTAGQQLGALGATAAQLEGADLARDLAASQQMGTLGQQAGTFASQDATRKLQAGVALGELTGEEQTSALQRLGALEAAGAAKQADKQRSLDLAYQDFLEQRDYDRSNLAFLNAAVRGLEVPTSVSSSATGPASVYQPSPLSQLAGAFGTYSGLRRLMRD